MLKAFCTKIERNIYCLFYCTLVPANDFLNEFFKVFNFQNLDFSNTSTPVSNSISLDKPLKEPPSNISHTRDDLLNPHTNVIPQINRSRNSYVLRKELEYFIFLTLKPHNG